MNRALERAMETRSPSLLLMLQGRGVAAALQRRDWNDAVEAAISFGRAKIVSADERYEGTAIADDTVVFDPLEPPSTVADREHAERLSLLVLSRAVVANLTFYVGSESTDAPNPMVALADVIDQAASQLQLDVVWKKFADIIRAASASSLSVSQHKDCLAVSSFPGAEHIVFAAHGLLAFHPDARVEQSVVSHICVLQMLDREAKTLDLSVEAYAEAVARYWVEATKRAAFRFRRPGMLTGAMQAATDKPPVLKAKVILTAVAESLSSRLDEEQRTWLKID